MKKIVLQKGRERSLLRKHPWIYSGAVKQITENISPGETVDVFSFSGQFLGRGSYSPSSQIRVRIWTWDEEEPVDAFFLKSRIDTAMSLRKFLLIPDETDAYRLIAAEADGLPGLIVDLYGRVLVCQFLSAGAEYWKPQIVDALKMIPGVVSIYDRSDADVRRKEGLEKVQGLLWGTAPPKLIKITEDELNFNVDIRSGHKTGFYLDQRNNRKQVRKLSTGKEVLNCFAYTGGFGVAALKGGARHVINVEDVAGLIESIHGNMMLNGFDSERSTNLKADVFKLLRRYDNESRRFDMIILDPPKFAESQSHLARASRGYKDVNRLALKLLRPGGHLFTFSCSGLMKMDLFQKIVADAAIDSGKDAQILSWLSQSDDHPVKLFIPETHYLKGLCIKVV